MERRIFKYPVETLDWIGPKILKVLGAAYQYDRLMVWCEVDVDSADEMYCWRFYPTGGVPKGEHVATLGGKYVWHLYLINGERVDGYDYSKIILDTVEGEHYIIAQ